MTAQNPTPTTPVPAATLLLCRQAETGFEVLLVKRHHRIDFASGALVFPGGKVCADDHAPAWADTAPAEIQSDLPFYLAACREAFEECGILYAYGEDAALISGPRAASLAAHREAIATGHASFHAFAQRERLRPAYDRFVPFARWITPPFMPKRFDTWFFLAETPDSQVAEHDGSESVDSIWITPQAALTGAAEGRYTIIFPTRCNLMLLAQSPTLDHAIETARTRPIVTIEPWLETRGDTRIICIPTDAGYPICEEQADFPA